MGSYAMLRAPSLTRDPSLIWIISYFPIILPSASANVTSQASAQRVHNPTTTTAPTMVSSQELIKNYGSH
jgi:hypothetical protein